MLYIFNAKTKRLYWKDDYFGFESLDRAQMYMDSHALYEQERKEVGSNLYIYVLEKNQLK